MIPLGNDFSEDRGRCVSTGPSVARFRQFVFQKTTESLERWPHHKLRRSRSLYYVVPPPSTPSSPLPLLRRPREGGDPSSAGISTAQATLGSRLRGNDEGNTGTTREIRERRSARQLPIDSANVSFTSSITTYDFDCAESARCRISPSKRRYSDISGIRALIR